MFAFADSLLAFPQLPLVCFPVLHHIDCFGTAVLLSEQRT